MNFRHTLVSILLMPALLVLPGAARTASAQDSGACLECHGSPQQITDAASMLELTISQERARQLVVHAPGEGNAHQGIGCTDCHPGADELPHPKNLLENNPCVTCHDDVAAKVNTSAHRDPSGDSHFRAPCWACHTAHDVYPVADTRSSMHPQHVASRCLQCHDKQQYLAGVHGFGVQLAGLDVAATCVSCHGGHDILAPSEAGSRVARRNISFTCGRCHGPVAQTYRASVHGAALTDSDNPDVPTCVGCHRAHDTADPRSPRFRLSSPQMCGKCHGNAAMMKKYGLSTEIFSTYVADFHGTTAELFQATSPDQPLNQAVCYDCHGFHDVQAVKGVGQKEIDERLLVKCQACHPGARFAFLSAWTQHYIPSPEHYPLIYYVRLFYRFVIPATVAFFLLYIFIDWRRRRSDHGRMM